MTEHFHNHVINSLHHKKNDQYYIGQVLISSNSGTAFRSSLKSCVWHSIYVYYLKIAQAQ